MLNVVIIILLVVIIFYVFHFIIINIGNLKKKKMNEKTNKKNFFAIIIAARNEEQVIGNLIKSLQRQKYPKDKYQIYVITNNCTDNTRDVAKEAGATVIECKEKVKSKGDVLKYTFKKLKNNKEIDVYAIFDADNLVENNFLNEMNKTINSGYNISQGFRDTKNISDNWLTSSYAILYYIDNFFINRARHNMYKSSFLNGTGFVVKKEIIDKYGYNVQTLTEDVEYTAICALNNEKIAFTETAIIYDEQVTDLKTSLRQRKRWSFGAKECFKVYHKDLLKKLIKDKSYECLDMLMFTMATVFQVVAALFTILITINTIINIDKLNISSIIISLVITMSITYLCGILFRIYLINKYNKKIKENIGGILLFDFFIITWIPINFICLFMDKCNWDSIKHIRNIDIKET